MRTGSCVGLDEEATSGRLEHVAAAVFLPLQLREVATGETAGGVSEAASGAPLSVTVRVGSGAPYRCPLYLLMAGSRSLRGMLDDAVSAAQEAAGDAAGLTAAALELPLPFVSAAVFESVVLYLEHFYGLATGNGASQQFPSPAMAGQLGAPQHRPAVLDAPLCLEDVYHLGSWEVCFALQRLVGLPELLRARAEGGGGQQRKDEIAATVALLENSAWVDALGVPPSSVSRPLPCGVFSLSERRTILDRLCETLEAATRLGVDPLQQLCAALIANMVVQLSPSEISSLVTVSAEGGQRVPLPPFTAQRREALLAAHPWCAAAATQTTARRG